MSSRVPLVGFLANGCPTRFERLEAVGLRPVWTEPNLLASTIGKGTGGGDPFLAEYTFINIRDSKSILVSGSVG